MNALQVMYRYRKEVIQVSTWMEKYDTAAQYLKIAQSGVDFINWFVPYAKPFAPYTELLRSFLVT